MSIDGAHVLTGRPTPPGDGSTKKVAVWLPKQATSAPSDQIWDLELEALTPIGAEVIEVRASDSDEFARHALGAHAVMTSWGYRLTADIIERLETCTVIGVGSVGVDMVDVDAATKAGIVVTNVPDVFIEEVADHTMMLLLAASRRLNQMAGYIAAADWYEARVMLSELPRLWGQTLGLLSFGNVARATARRARSFGLRVIAYDPYVSELTMTAEDVEPVSLAELLAHSDFLSVHAPDNAETHDILGAHELAAMKRSAVVINTSRGGTIDEGALIDAVQQNRIAFAALDALKQEPADPASPLLHLPNVIVTPHVASATSRMRPETRRRVGREIALVLTGRWPMSCVNPGVLPRLPLERWQPHPMNRGPSR